jgi:hypothetical protein
VFKAYYRLNDREAIESMAARTGFVVESISYVSTSAATAMLGPLVVPELVYLRALRRPGLASLRSILVVRLRKA